MPLKEIALSNNAFLKPIEFYQREVSPISQYADQMSFYLSKMTGKDIAVCREFIGQGFKTNSFPGLVDPKVTYYQRDEVGDRYKHECSLSRYLQDVNKNQEILAPTFTTYMNTSQKRSLLVEFLDANVARRSKAKKEAFKAKAEKKTELYIIKNNEQTNMKLYNNSMSGAFATKGSVLNNPTAHSTLTSITRTESSLGNASNEKIIAGNRHYRTPDITFDNIISITSSLDKPKILEIMTKYSLHYPTVKDVVDCIQYSSDLYWKDTKAFQKIYDFILALDDIERAGFVYISDLFHLRKHNNLFIKHFLTKLAFKNFALNEETKSIDQYSDEMRKFDEHIVNYAHQICMTEVKGLGKDYSKMSVENLKTLCHTCDNIKNTVNSYSDFIDAFFLTKNTPASTAFIPNMIRRAVVLSDTDSTMFSVDEYVTWYFGELVFTDEAFALAGAVMFIATQCIGHVLALFSANMNVERKKLFSMAMKPEFVFPVFAQTSVAKHYYTCIAVQEGNVFQDLEMEIKGVHLKNSASPKSIIKPAHDRMRIILEKIMKGEKISIIEEIKLVADLERHIIKSLGNAEVEYYKQSKIKNHESYSRDKELSPYVYHMLWEDVFAAKYKSIEPPPYGVIKIPTTIENVTALKAWVESIKDRELASRLAEWIGKLNKTSLPTIYISVQYVISHGIPEEIKPIINFKKIVLDLTNVNRMILESLGYCPKSEWMLSELGY